MTSYIFYEGPSALTGEPIVGIATMDSRNAKTGPLIQTYILDATRDPVTARKTGHDRNICGECPLKTANACYVLLHQAPQVLFNHKHQFKSLKRSLLRNRAIRLGSYGDPAAIPIEIWDSIVPKCTAHTGYTHQWAKFPEFKKYCQASVETLDQAKQAQVLGFKTYRVMLPNEKLADNETPCLYPKLQCIQCGLCDGTKKNVAQVVHGSWQPKKYQEFRNEHH